MKSIKSKLIVLALFVTIIMTGCSKASRVSYNVSREADEFNIVRKITVINGIKGDVLYQMTGKMSIEEEGNQLIVIAVDENGKYKKHFVGLSDNVSYIVEDVTGTPGIDDQYHIYFNPEMIVPIEVKLAD